MDVAEQSLSALEMLSKKTQQGNSSRQRCSDLFDIFGLF
jgi:hypothetical protein